MATPIPRSPPGYSYRGASRVRVCSYSFFRPGCGLVKKETPSTSGPLHKYLFCLFSPFSLPPPFAEDLCWKCTMIIFSIPYDPRKEANFLQILSFPLVEW
jgi:hypothetical protein